MTRQIKAAEVREGMEIRWEEDGAVITLPVFEVMAADCGRVSFVPESRTPWHVKRDQTVTVLKEPQPDEPTAFGACVEVVGVKYVRAGSDAWPWTADETPHEIACACDWRCLTKQGHVRVINPDPFANVQAEPEPRVWERWEDVPDMTAVRSTTGNVYRKAPGGTERQTLAGEWWPSILATRKMRSLAPFTEVLPGA